MKSYRVKFANKQVARGTEIAKDSTGEDARMKEEPGTEGEQGRKSRDILRDVASVGISYFSSPTKWPRTRGRREASRSHV